MNFVLLLLYELIAGDLLAMYVSDIGLLLLKELIAGDLLDWFPMFDYMEFNLDYFSLICIVFEIVNLLGAHWFNLWYGELLFSFILYSLL